MPLSRKIKYISIIQVLLIAIFISSNFFVIRKTISLNLETDSTKKYLEDSDYQEINPFVIIGNDEWEQLANSVPWCNGSGTIEDPYIINNVFINGRNQNNCVTISDTSVYFIIQNCFFNNSKDYYTFAGIYLENVENSKVLNNILLFHHNGIKLLSSYNNLIKDNLLEFCYSGIHLSASSYNTISNNKAKFNEFRGISVLHDSNFNLIYENNINHSGFDGITVLHTNNNKIFNNTILNFKYHGIWTDGYTLIKNNVIKDGHTSILVWGYSNNITGNRFKNCGISFSKRTYSLEELSSQIIDTSNLVNGNPVYYYVKESGLRSNNFTNAGQVLLVKCHNLKISNLKISNTTEGIFSYSSSNLNISSCKIENTTGNAINLEYCDDNLISNNNIKNSFHGIDLFFCDKSTILNNFISSSSYGLSLGAGNNYLIQGNTVIKNRFNGLYIVDGHDNIILNNNCSNNGDGIHISGNTELVLKKNIVNNNRFEGIDLFDISNSIISENTVKHNGLQGIQFTSGTNTNVYENIVSLNGRNGFDLGGVHNCHFRLNIANNNEIFGFYLSNCDNNIIQNNLINNNYCGINFTLNSDNNLIIGNSLKANTVCYYQDDTCVGNIFENNICQEFNPDVSIILTASILMAFSIMATIYLILNKKKR